MNLHRLHHALACLVSHILAISFVCAQDIVWNFDETGVPVIAKDSSGNNRNGKVVGNITFVSPGISGGAYGGFTSPKSQVIWEAGDNGYKNLGRTDLTLALWIKNPGDAGHVTIAGVGNPGNHNRAWELWLGSADAKGSRTINLASGHWNGGSQNYSSEKPITLDSDTWYFLAFTWEQEGKGFPRKFAVYLAKQGSKTLGEPVFLGVAGQGINAGPADSRILYIGGNVAGWPGNNADNQFGQYFKDGYFGGSIDNVTIWLNRTLTSDQLNAAFQNP